MFWIILILSRVECLFFKKKRTACVIFHIGIVIKIMTTITGKSVFHWIFKIIYFCAWILRETDFFVEFLIFLLSSPHPEKCEVQFTRFALSGEKSDRDLWMWFQQLFVFKYIALSKIFSFLQFISISVGCIEILFYCLSAIYIWFYQESVCFVY